MSDSQQTEQMAADALVDSEFRYAATMLEKALRALDNGLVEQAREYIMKARSCYLVAVQRIPSMSQNQERMEDLQMHCDMMDNALRTVERIAEGEVSGKIL